MRSSRAPFWPIRCLFAFLSALQRLPLLTSRPFFPPAMFEDEFEMTGASGIVSNVVRRPAPLTLSIRAETSMSNCPLEVDDQVGQFVRRLARR